MKIRKIITIVVMFLGCSAITAFGQNQNGCTDGLRNGFVYTDCWADSGDDTSRLQSALSRQAGKVIFNESNYSISGSLTIFSYRSIEGTTSNQYAVYGGSNITQTANAPIFTIGEGVYNVTIQNLAFLAGPGTTTAVGIKASGTNGSSQNFHFTNLQFVGLDKGIYVEANGGQFQFDNIRLEHSYFQHCNYGVHVNSWNSGWNISSINIDAKLNGIGFWFQKSTYTSVNLVIGNGNTGGQVGNGSKLFLIQEHGNLNIQNTVSEGFNEDIDIDSPAQVGVIYLMNNHYNGKVTVKNAMVISTGNSFGFPGAPAVVALAKGTSSIFSNADKFCTYNNFCTDGWQFQDTARMISETGVFKNSTTVPSFMNSTVNISRDIYDGSPNLTVMSPNYSGGPQLRLGRGTFFYDVTRSEGGADPGHLQFVGNQVGYGGYTFSTQGGTVKVNYDGSVTFGSVTYSGLGGSANGTMVYCSNCQQTSTCTSGGAGAIAKRIAGTWKCN